MTTRSPVRTTRARPRRTTPVTRRVTSTEAKNRFGQVFDAALEGTVVVITKHAAPKAVLLSYDVYRSLTGAAVPTLDQLRTSFDALLARMQTGTVRAGTRAGFRASSKQLGKAAVALAAKGG